ncbi:MAG: TonB-dependent receptor [Bacteroidota bacterium]
MIAKRLCLSYNFYKLFLSQLRKRRILLIKGGSAIALLLISTLLSAQQKGEVNGTIQDEAGELVAYANVQLMGTSMGAISNEKGFYSIQNVPPGTYELRVTFVGYSDSQATVQVSAGGVTTQDFRLTMTSIMGEEVVVTAMARGQARAINTQIASKNIKNVVSEQKIRELPDANAAEALARLPGVSVIRDGGEATQIKVRGVGANTMFVNGMRLDGGLGSISPRMIGSIELHKAFMADQDADVLGGNVTFKMREALPGFRKDIEIRTGYNGFTKSFKNHDVSLLLSNRFFNDRLGVMLSLNYDRKDRGRDILSGRYKFWGASVIGSEDIKEIELYAVDLNRIENLNQRYGTTLYTDYRLKGGKLFYQGWFNQRNSQKIEYDNSYRQSYTNYSSARSQGVVSNFLHGVGGEHTLLGAKVEWGVSMSNLKDEKPTSLYLGGGNPSGNNMGAVGVDSSTTISEYIINANHDVALTEINNAYYDKEELYSKELAARLDVEVPFRVGSKIDGYVKFGGKVRDMKRGFDRWRRGSSFGRHSGEMLGDTAIARLPDFGWQYTPNTEFGILPLAVEPYAHDFSLMGAQSWFHTDFDKLEYVLDVCDDILHRYMAPDKDDYTNTQRNYAAYIMAGIDIGEFITFMPGVRYEKYEYSTTARWFVQGEGYGPYETHGQIGDTVAGSISEDLFPMVHLKIKPAKWFDIRLAATKTLTRPSFTQMSPRYWRQRDLTQTLGNPNLKPQTNYNYDIYLSFYTGKTGLFTIGAFYKKLTDQVLDYERTIIDAEEVYGFDPIYEGKEYNQPVNNEWPGYVQGVEVDWQTHFSFLPKPFSGILLNMNLTYMQSETRYPFYSFYKEYLDVPPYVINIGQHDSRVNTILGMPDMIANVALGYELGGFSGRISAYYQDNTITTAQASQKSLDEDKDALLRLDMQFSQKLKKVPGLMFYLNINNMTNNTDRLIMTYHPEKIRREEVYGVSGDIGVRYKF